MNRLKTSRLTESVIGVILLLVTLLLGVAGLVADLLDQSDPPTLFGGALVFGIAAIAVAQDEHHRTGGQTGHWSEALFGRVLVALAVVLEIIALITGLAGSDNRNLWLVLAIIVALDGLAVLVDTRRLVVARGSSIETRTTTDALPGAIAGALGLGLGIVGVLAGLTGSTHAPAWLYAGVIFALLANAFMFDEHAHVDLAVRGEKSLPRRKSAPFKR